MTGDVGAEWLAFAVRRPVNDVLALGLDDGQLVTLGKWLSKNKLLNPPKTKKVHVGTFVCQCGCGEKFTAEYITTRPKYKNETHRKRYWRARWRAEGKEFEWLK